MRRVMSLVLSALGVVLGANAAALPTGYTQVEYIESTSGGGQYINTGYTPHKGTKVVCRLLDNGTDTSSGYGTIFGSRQGWSRTKGMYFWLRRDGNTQPCYGRAGAQGNKDKATFPFGDVTTVTCEGRTCSWVNDAGTKTDSIELSANYEEEQEDGITPLLIFALNSSAEVGGCNPSDHWGFRLYSFKIYEGEALVRNFVPCVETATGRAGLYDTVEGKFHENKGSGAFGAPVIYCDSISGETKSAEAVEVTGLTETFEDGKWYFVKGYVRCGEIKVYGSANLILCDGAWLAVNGGDRDAGKTHEMTVFGTGF